MAYKSDVIYVTNTEAQQPFTEQALGFVAGNVYLSVETQNIRVWYDNKRIPTSTDGHPLYAGGGYTFYGQDAAGLKMIAVTGTAKVTYTAKGL